MFRLMMMLAALVALVSGCGGENLKGVETEGGVGGEEEQSDDAIVAEEAGEADGGLLADNEVEAIADQQAAEEIDADTLRALRDIAREEALRQGPKTTRGFSFDDLISDLGLDFWNDDDEVAAPAPTEANEDILEELIVGHNRLNRRHRENIVFIGYGSARSKDYLIEQAKKVVDMDGDGVSTSIYRNGRWVDHLSSGLFGQDVLAGHEDKFNFWYVDLEAWGLERSRSTKDFCLFESDFEGIEDDILGQVSLRHKTFVHLLSNTDCRSQAKWFRVRADLRIWDLVTEALDWGRIWSNIEEVIDGDLSFYEALTDGVDWEEMFSRIIDFDTHPSAFCNLKDRGRSSPRATFIDTCLHEVAGHGLARFVDEYSDGDLAYFDTLKNILDFRINLADIFGSWTRSLYGIPSVRINLFEALFSETDLFASNCAISSWDGASRWGAFAGQGEGDLKIRTTKGCLYSSTKFYRSSKDSKMRSSTTPFNIYQEDHIEDHFLSRREE